MKKLSAIMFGVFFVISLLYVMSSDGSQIFNTSFMIVQPKPVQVSLEGESPEPNFFTSEAFEISGGTKNLQLAFNAPVNNSWVYVAGNLVNTETEQAYPFEAEIEYYYGRSGGESWSEGSRNETLTLGGIPSGTYRLVAATKYHQAFNQSRQEIRVRVYRDVWMFRYIFMIFLLVTAFPLIQWLRYQNFETRRWADSDYGGDE